MILFDKEKIYLIYGHAIDAETYSKSLGINFKRGRY